MKSLSLLATTLCIAFAASTAHANGLHLTTVHTHITLTGNTDSESLTDFSPHKGTVQNGGITFDTISSGETVPKNAHANYTFTDEYTVSVNAFEIDVNVKCANIASGSCAHDPYNPFTVTVRDTALYNAVVTIDKNPSSLYQVFFSGDLITIDFLGGGNPSGMLKLGLAFSPEPSSLALLGTGLLGLAFFARRRITV